MSYALFTAGSKFGRISLLRVTRPVQAHAHPQCHALFKVSGADSFFSVAGVRYPLVSGNAVLVNSWQPHEYPHEPWRGPSLVLALYIEPAWLAEIDRRFAASGRGDFFPSACVALPADTTRVVAAMAEELQGRHPEQGHAAALLERLMTMLIVRHSRWGEFAAGPSMPAALARDRRIRKAIGLLREAPEARADFGRIAREVGLSRAHFFELFRANTGLTPHIFRNAIRMEKAYGRLLGSDGSVGAIARDLGFTAPGHFTRFFQDNHGVAPTAYRQALGRL